MRRRFLGQPVLSIALKALLAAEVLVVSMAGGVGAAAPADPASPTQRQWASRYHGPGDDDIGYDVGVSPNGSTVFVTGSSYRGVTAEDFATVAYDAATGTELWVSRYRGPGESYDAAFALGVSPDGSTVFVTGISGLDLYDYATVAYDANSGAELWVSRYNGPGDAYDYVRDLGVSPDGSTVFVMGWSRVAGIGSEDYATVAYDSTTGAELWASRYNGPGDWGDYAHDLAVSTTGSAVFVTGSSRGELFDDYATVAYDAVTGTEVWVSRYDSALLFEDDYAQALGVSPDGSTVFVTGRSSIPGDFATVAYDAANGAELWVSRYEGGSGSPSDIEVSPDGSTVFVTGYSDQEDTGIDYATVAYDAATGDELWASVRGRRGLEFPNALGVSPDGTKVFVSGERQKSSDDSDYATVSYDAATGDTLGFYRAGKSGDDAAYALALSPDGSMVFVTGKLQVNQDGRTDYLTIAYAT